MAVGTMTRGLVTDAALPWQRAVVEDNVRKRVVGGFVALFWVYGVHRVCGEVESWSEHFELLFPWGCRWIVGCRVRFLVMAFLGLVFRNGLLNLNGVCASYQAWPCKGIRNIIFFFWFWLFKSTSWGCHFFLCDVFEDTRNERKLSLTV